MTHEELKTSNKISMLIKMNTPEENYKAFSEILIHARHLSQYHITARLYQEAETDEQRKDMVLEYCKKNDTALKPTCDKYKLEFLTTLIEEHEEAALLKKKIIRAGDYKEFSYAVNKGDSELIRLIFEVANEDDRKNMLEYRECETFRLAIKRNHLQTADLIWSLASELEENSNLTKENLLKKDNYNSFDVVLEQRSSQSLINLCKKAIDLQDPPLDLRNKLLECAKLTHPDQEKHRDKTLITTLLIIESRISPDGIKLFDENGDLEKLTKELNLEHVVDKFNQLKDIKLEELSNNISQRRKNLEESSRLECEPNLDEKDQHELSEINRDEAKSYAKKCEEAFLEILKPKTSSIKSQVSTQLTGTPKISKDSPRS